MNVRSASLAIASLSMTVLGCASAPDKLLPPREMHHIADDIANCANYESLNPRFRAAFEFLKRPDLASLADGTYTIVKDPAGGKDLAWAILGVSPLKPFGAVQHPEVHARYIDIQAPLSGEETIGLIDMDAAATPGFDAEKDIGFIDAATRPQTLKPGQFAIFFPPHGGHAPCCALDGSKSVRKVVIKVLR